MSLASTAFPWTNDDINKKKTPMMNRKTIKTRPNVGTPNSPDEYMIFNTTEVQEIIDDRSNKVTDIINQMTSVSVDNEGSKLADFTPPPNPEIQQKKPAESNLGSPIQMPPSQDRPVTDVPRPSTYSNQPVNPFTSPTAPPLGNYSQVYSAPPTSIPFMTNATKPANKPFYTNMGLGQGGDKVIEKMNYMIHMLENMEGEKTANVTEEFVLYTFTGIFIIYVLDTFLRTGKYVR